MARSSAPKKCLKCPFWIYSRTFGSPDVPVYHCRFGYSPYPADGVNGDCYQFALDVHPDLDKHLQLSIDFPWNV